MTVVVVMFVGFVLASAIAAAVVHTIDANLGNGDDLDAFVAAESGRDVAVAAIVDGCTAADMSGSGTIPVYSYEIRTVDGPEPTSFDALTSNACPTADTDYVVIRSIGTGVRGGTSTIDSVYRWSSRYSDVPGGVVTYFSGSVSQGVSHYTGDLVLRNGNWTCTEGGTLTGDLYVLNGSVTLSNNCVINGDIFARGNVGSNSQDWHVRERLASGSPGNIVTDGTVSFTSNGDPSVAGSIHSRGQVALSAAGGGIGTVGGTVTSMNPTDSVDTGAWTTGAVSLGSSTEPPFVPTLAWLEDASKWIDLDRTSGWNGAGVEMQSVVSSSCNTVLQNQASASTYVRGVLGAGTAPVIIDFTACNKNVSVKLDVGATIRRDAVVLVPRNSSMTFELGSGLSADAARQLLLVHEDANRDDRDVAGDPKPTCGIGGQDGFDTTGPIDTDIRVMIYSPCGLQGTVTASFEGQLYTDDTTNFHAGSNYTCRPMSWPGALPSLGCAIKGSGGIIDSTTIIQELGELVYQTER
ncbi:hypothetical protein [Microbacterium sp. Marseille-Q6648]|uniref:hypothetical protein n=1 Tax=Microbacterium sp. Marseille-Q6648 TaxID=2937991 RepID=UPI00203D11A1|nr:hypothetical protein [Microbacterium sp. Marseille-Q6648]